MSAMILLWSSCFSLLGSSAFTMERKPKDPFLPDGDNLLIYLSLLESVALPPTLTTSSRRDCAGLKYLELAIMAAKDSAPENVETD
nr:hypothetical protein Itr_chr14CG31850 [Ipomoea trifida]